MGMSGENSKIFKLLKYALTDSSVFLPDGKYSSELADDCLVLFKRDYVCTSLDNSRGQLCSTYPVQLIVPVKEKMRCLKEGCPNNENDVDNTELVELVQRGRFARTRGRFPAPVLLVGGKFICRSSTLARSPEIYGRTSYQYLLHGEAMPQAEHDNNIANGSPAKNGMVLDGEYPEDSVTTTIHYKAGKDKVNGNYVTKASAVNGGKSKLIQSTSAPGYNGQNKEWLVDKMRNTDIDLLHMLNVNVICDFMVEKKKVKFGLNVTSSEKVDREQRYADFDLISIPYPGCEFFADYTNNNYMGEGLKFDWTQQFVDAALQLPDNMKNIAEVQWNDYMHWDIVKLTQNYVKLLLNCLSRQNSTGILLHCISGWDRTPLFVSLLRLSLWADGLVHQSLSPEEVVYLTLAYDWLLFSHQFADRIDKCEEIMHFCFDFLKYIRSPIFSLLTDPASLEQLRLSDNEANEEVFYLEAEPPEQMANGTINEDLKLNGHTSQSPYPRPCKHNKPGDSHQTLNPYSEQNGFSNGNVNSVSHLVSEVSLDEVQSCLNCIIDEIGQPEKTSESVNSNCNQLTNGHHINNNSISERISLNEFSELPNDNAPAPVLPLESSRSPLICRTCLDNGETRGVGLSENANIFTEPQTPRSALSSSYETAKTNLFSKTSVSDIQQAKGLSNSFTIINDQVESLSGKSEPIGVPVLSHVKKSAISDCLGNSCESSESIRTNTAEPGSSWQMIASPPQLSAQRNDSSNFLLGISQSNQSDPPSSRKSSMSSSIYGSNEHDLLTLKAKLARRAERLDGAQNVMIPAYCAVVQQRRMQEQQTGTLSSIFGHLAQFVKRT